jgi:two-component system, cell cycle response regulator DivK
VLPDWHFARSTRLLKSAPMGFSYWSCLWHLADITTTIIDVWRANRSRWRWPSTAAACDASAACGEEALTAVEAQRPDLILMDIQLPVMDGYEAARRIKSNPDMKAVPVIAMTAYALAGDEAKAMAAGCNGYVTKPFSPRALLAKVREYLP